MNAEVRQLRRGCGDAMISDIRAASKPYELLLSVIFSGKETQEATGDEQDAAQAHLAAIEMRVS